MYQEREFVAFIFISSQLGLKETGQKGYKFEIRRFNGGARETVGKKEKAEC